MTYGNRNYKVVIYDYSYGYLDLSEQLRSIMIDEEMKFLYENSYIVRYSIFSPITKFYQNLHKGPVYSVTKKTQFKFYYCRNATDNKTTKFNKIGIIGKHLYKDIILIGYLYNNDNNLFTLLSKNYYHSVCDDESKKALQKMNISAYNTGNPMFWSFDETICKMIPNKKSLNNVVFTLDCKNTNINRNKKIIKILFDNYKNVYFFPKKYGDASYLLNFNLSKNIKVLKYNVESYESILNKDIDFIGDDLCSCIYAMKHKKRSIFITSNRDDECLSKKYGINFLPSSDIEKKLDKKINSRFVTKILVNKDAIKAWKNQFGA